jgi:hypothetical protein
MIVAAVLQNSGTSFIEKQRSALRHFGTAAHSVPDFPKIISEIT